MRLLFVIDHFGPGGAQRQMVTLALGLHGSGHRVEFFVYFPEDYFVPALEDAGINIHLHDKRGRYSPSPILALRRLMKRGGYDAVLSYLITPNFYAEIAGLGIRRPPLVVSQRRSFPAGRLPLKIRLLQNLHRLADHIVSNSDHQRERMVAHFPWMSDKISTIVNGVDLQAFSAPEPDHAEREDGPLELLAVGRIDENKNVPCLVRALEICRDKHGLAPRVRWAGRHEPTAEGAAYFAELTGLIERAGVADSWEWLGVRTDVPELMRAHRALVHPSLSEGFSNVVCEALASGKPILAGTIGDHPRLIQEGRTGFLFDPADPAQIAEAIHRLASLTVAERAEMGRAARRFAEREMSVPAVVDRYADLFERLIDERSRRS